MKALWNGVVIAESNDTVVVEENHYFPISSINNDYFIPGEIHTTCEWKGEASYYSLSVIGKLNVDAAWFYPRPKAAAREIKNRIAFWKGVEITD
ncbi:MAG: DUF427 domain-containing protein [Gammaproteobacteria bacterium]|nr:DUF427 domain-containing protein [Gammaproteobacteria bacterium]